MGTLHYGNDAIGIGVEDETLTHLSAVVVAKLRRQEPFLLTCASDTGREAIWIHAGSDLRFAFSMQEPIALDRSRLEEMVKETNRPSGLVIACEASADVAPIERIGVAA